MNSSNEKADIANISSETETIGTNAVIEDASMAVCDRYMCPSHISCGICIELKSPLPVSTKSDCQCKYSYY